MKRSIKIEKKSKGRKTSLPDIASHTYDEKISDNIQPPAEKNPVSTKAPTEVETKEECKQGKNEKSTNMDKSKKKSARVKAESNSSTQRTVSKDKEDTLRQPSSENDQGCALKISDTVNETEIQDHQQTNEAESTNKNCAERKRKIRSKSRSPCREITPSNKKTKTTLNSAAEDEHSIQSAEENSQQQDDQGNTRNESLDRHHHDCLERTRSPIRNFELRGSNSYNKSQRVDRVGCKQSPSSKAANKHRSNIKSRQAISFKNDSQGFQPQNKVGFSVATRGDSQKTSLYKFTGQNTTEKKDFAETSTNTDTLNSKLESISSHVYNSSKAKTKNVRGKSPKFRLKIPKHWRVSSKADKKAKIERLLKEHQSSKKILSGKNNNTIDKEGKLKKKKWKHLKKYKKK